SEGLYKLASLDQAAENFSLPAQVRSSFLTCINIDKAGDFLIGTNDGLLRFSPSNNKFTDLSGRYGKGYQVRSIYLDGEENIWLATSDGLKCIRNEDGVVKEYAHDPRNHKSLNGN